MKLKQIALLIAGFTLSAAAYAAPVTIAQIEAARGAGQLDQAWISGATAPTRTVYEGWVGSGAGVGCDATTNTIFTSQGGTNVVPGALGNYLAYACTRAGKVSVLYHTLDGGSLNAYAPHTVGTKLARLKYVGSPTANPCVSVGNYVDPTNADNNAAVFKSCTQVGANTPAAGPNPTFNASNQALVNADSNAPSLPVGGFSDVEAALFDATIGGGNVTSKGTEGNANVTQVFGVAVSIPLYRALQTAQVTGTPAQIAADTTFDPAFAPNITQAQYVSIAAQGGAYQTDWQPLVGAAGAGKKVILARRVSTSGTQASSNSFFLQNPCAKGLGADLSPAVTSDSSSTFEVFEGSGSGNVKTRLSTASGTIAVPNTGPENFAIGILSVENDWRADAAASAGYRFVKVNGVHPEAGDTVNGRLTAISGAYEFAKELKNFTANTATGFGANVVNQITAALSAPPAAACAVLPRGLALNPLAGSSCGAAQVAKVTNLGNNCSPFQLVQ